MIRMLSSALGAAALTAAAPAQVTGPETRLCGDYGEPHPDMPGEFGQFAFLIGDYDVGVRNWDAETESWGEPEYFARWNGRYIFGGRAIADEWFDPGYGYREASGAGINIRLRDAEADVWKTAWHSTANTEVRELRQAVREDGKLHLWQVWPEAPERNVWFETYEDGRWARISMARDEETGDWVPSVKLDAVPAECAAAE
ncbi:hypothetical protein DDZ18_11195 [Marinicauda salina]|uniref:Uncharacterized protein n=1 Tax=Marinicauda salina TaxID=2135793 RepID=A0A2U2BS00_9PROT|nr:hypothetical protein [Marinicauda salina]PWE16758.1 hypothetical protein DDZ18_11195 [Marinicauda salina]